MPARARTAALLASALAAVALGAAPATAASGTITGTAFADLDRDGVHSADEPAFDDHLLYLYDEAGSYVANRRSNEQGRFTFTGVAAGTYTLGYAPSTWRDVRDDWVPTTTGTLQPEHIVTVSGNTITADFGWRPIVTSDVLSEPITDFTGPEGLRVQSYNDVVAAEELYEHITTEFLVRDEAPETTVRFAYGSSDSARTTIWRANGAITRVRVIVYASYVRWLTVGDRTLAHEYGHAWMNYHNYYVQQDVDMEWEAFLQARGVDPEDDRLGTSYAWNPSEIAAEDYRQLFASENARSGGQLNGDIPPPQEIAGLEEFLRDVLTQPPGSGHEPDEEPVEADPQDPSPGDGDPEPDAQDDERVIPELTVTPRKVRGLNHAELFWTGPDGAEVAVRRDDEVLVTTTATAHTDDTVGRGSPTHIYRVCVTDTAACSDPVKVGF